MRTGILIGVLVLLVAASTQAEIRDLSYENGQISCVLTETQMVTVAVCSAAGGHWATVYAGTRAPGKHSIPWNGKDDFGRALPAGEYVLKARVGQTATRDTHFGGAGFVPCTNPTCVRTDEKGDVYVVDLSNAGPAAGSGWGHLKKFRPDGSPAADFFAWYGAKPTEPKVNAINLPRFTMWIEFGDDDKCILYNDKNNVTIITNPVGKKIGGFGGFEWLIDSEGRRIARTGSAWPLYGLAVGSGNKVYIRDQHAIRAYDRSKPGFEGYLYSSAEDLDYPPVLGVSVGPCIAADQSGRIYVTGQHGLTRFTDANGKIQKNYGASVRFKECMGLALARSGMVYVVDRGLGPETENAAAAKPPTAPQPFPRVYQFWDNGAELIDVWHLEDKELSGLHDVAAGPDGMALYVVEDADNFGSRIGDPTLRWPQRNLQGKGRLFKYNLSHTQEVSKTIHVP